MAKYLGNVDQVDGDVSGSTLAVTDETSGVSSAILQAGTTYPAAGLAKAGVGTTTPGATLDVRGHSGLVAVINCRAPQKTYTITSRSRTSNVATIEIGTHGFIDTESIAVSGVSDATFNTVGSSIVAVTATSVSYSNAGTNTALTASGGTATVVMSANLQTWQDATPTTVASVSKTGAITAASFAGDGSALTNLDAGDIATGTLPLTRGGTGQTTASDAINALVPTQTGNSGKFLTTNATSVSWGTPAATPPGGSNTQVQFNDGGAFGGDAGLTYDKTTDTLTAGTFSGSGSGLTSLNATNVSSGYLNTLRGGAPEGLIWTGGRLSLSSGSAISDTNITGASTIYYQPYTSNVCSVYDSTLNSYRPISLTSVPTLTLSGLTTGKNYDVWASAASGVFSLSLSAAWTNDTTRADGIAFNLNSGAWEKASSILYRYLGTIRATSSTTTEDSTSNRFVWNAYNQVPQWSRSPFVASDVSTTSASLTSLHSSMTVVALCGLISNVKVHLNGVFINTGVGAIDAQIGYQPGSGSAVMVGSTVADSTTVYCNMSMEQDTRFSAGAYNTPFMWARAAGGGTLQYHGATRGGAQVGTWIALTVMG